MRTFGWYRSHTLVRYPGCAMADVVVYTKRWCGYCEWARRLLAQRGVPFTEIDVTSDRALHSEMMERSGRRTVPQIFIGGESIGGYDDLAALDRSGRLDAMLAACTAPTSG